MGPEAGDAPRSALVVASYEYEDAGLRRLRAPARDAEALAEVLRDPAIGAFDVRLLVNEPAYVVRLRIQEFFSDRGRDDLLLLYFSCHGVKDDEGHLFFATRDTLLRMPDATSVESAFVNEQMNKTRSRRVVLLLDCCYSGAFARGMVPKAGTGVGIREHFEGRGRIVLTASNAMEYAFEEGDRVEEAARPSVFTGAGRAAGRGPAKGRTSVPYCRRPSRARGLWHTCERAGTET